jgi:hypothetical protein
MPSLKISETRKSGREADQIVLRPVNGEVSEVAGREMCLTITKTDSQDITVRGKLADAALAILRLHGF